VDISGDFFSQQWGIELRTDFTNKRCILTGKPTWILTRVQVFVGVRFLVSFMQTRRQSAGKCSLVGICCNTAIFSIKYCIGPMNIKEKWNSLLTGCAMLKR
jgi:hypothetical protein